MFADMSVKEFVSVYTGLNITKYYKPVQETFEPSRVQGDIVNWKDKGAVTGVKNQGQCGSCWSFSTTGSVEGARFIAGKGLVSLSEQNLVDCSVPEGNQGCNGGLPSDAFDYTAQGGLDTEDNYPYKAVDQKCSFNSGNALQVNSAYKNVTIDATQMKLAVAQQPVSVGIEADQLVFQFYFGGVISKYCGDSLDHGVLVVGYDVIKGTEAYIVKNSWGSSWGDKGYVYISTDPTANNGNGVCGILAMATIPVLE